MSECVKAAEEGQLLRRQGHLEAARRQLVTCASDACPDVVRRDCAEWTRALDASQPHLVIRAVDAAGHDLPSAGWRIDRRMRGRVDGHPVAVDPGVHDVSVDAGDGRAGVERVVVSLGEERRVVVQLPAEAVPSPEVSLVPPLVGASVGVVGLGAFVLFETSWRSRYSDLEESCGRTGTCAPDDVGTVRRDLFLARGSLIVSAVAFGVATWLFLRTPERSPRASHNPAVLSF